MKFFIVVIISQLIMGFLVQYNIQSFQMVSWSYFEQRSGDSDVRQRKKWQLSCAWKSEQTRGFRPYCSVRSRTIPLLYQFGTVSNLCCSKNFLNAVDIFSLFSSFFELNIVPEHCTAMATNMDSPALRASRSGYLVIFYIY
jgi:hypothetical protein